ncbi:MAG: glycoside hydrolase family 1 protein [Floccifex porci]|uniref:glycoside hydrolase family 1 protein n=1 Tax=Floccifex porci TaxID=2606629 RepID=UPI0023F2C2A9|nr:glycoside hydrolase family 1 protein [Floccifex porci]MDD7466417.1 glycoside hydrolase family 1 protein [Floccifex porci]
MKIRDDFFIGTSSSSWQIEGNHKNSNPSWADLFYQKDPSLWYEKTGVQDACDFIHHYKEDIEWMAKAGMNVFRFTIQWPYFLKDVKKGIVNEQAKDFYNHVIDTILSYGMEPFISLEHWDLPALFLEEFDGWCNRKILDYYRIYARKVFECFSDRVHYFFAFTEPNIPIDNGYMDKKWYPFVHDPKKCYQAHFHKMVATSIAKQEYLPFQKQTGGKLGAMIHYTPVYPRSDSKEDLEAWYYADLLQVRIYLDPYVKGKISDEFMNVLKENDCMFSYKPEDMELIDQYRIDLLGLDYYFPIRVKQKETEFKGIFHPEKYYDLYIKPDRRFNSHRGWEIYPQAILDAEKRIQEEYQIPWFISENGIGISNEDRYRENGQIQDTYRIEFLKEHLECALQCKSCMGYLIWSYIDNVSALNAFKNRYGLLELNTKTQERIPKKSYDFFKEINHKREI